MKKTLFTNFDTEKVVYAEVHTKSGEVGFMCGICGDLYCDGFSNNSIAITKIRKRKAAGLCMACGKKPCECKHKA